MGRRPIHTHCTVEGCDRKHYAKGLCAKHWRAARGYNDAIDPSQPAHRCTVEDCDRKHYAKGLCFKHWRAAKGYGPGGDRKAANARYDQTEAGRERQKRAMRKLRVIKGITGKSVTDSFNDPTSLAQLRQNKAELQKIWDLLTEPQKAAIQGKRK
jgi:hypothetical protein